MGLSSASEKSSLTLVKKLIEKSEKKKCSDMAFNYVVFLILFIYTC